MSTRRNGVAAAPNTTQLPVEMMSVATLQAMWKDLVRDLDEIPVKKFRAETLRAMCRELGAPGLLKLDTMTPFVQEVCQEGLASALANLDSTKPRPLKRRNEEVSETEPTISTRTGTRKRPITRDESSTNTLAEVEEPISDTDAHRPKRTRRGAVTGSSGAQVEVILKPRGIRAPAEHTPTEPAKRVTRGRAQPAEPVDDITSTTPALSTRARTRVPGKADAVELEESASAGPSRSTRARNRPTNEPVKVGPPTRSGARARKVNAPAPPVKVGRPKRTARPRVRGRSMNQTAARKARPKSEEVDYEDDSDAELDQEEGDDVVNTPSHRTRARAAVARGRAPEDPELAGAPRRGARSRRATQKAREADSLESDEEDEDDSQDEEERTSPKWSRFMGVYVLPLAEARKKRLRELGKSASPDKDTDHHGQGPVINVGSDEDAEGEEDEAEGENGWGGLGTQDGAGNFFAPGYLNASPSKQAGGTVGPSTLKPASKAASKPPSTIASKPISTAISNPITKTASQPLRKSTAPDIFSNIDLSVPLDDDDALTTDLAMRAESLLDAAIPVPGASAGPSSVTEPVDPLDADKADTTDSGSAAEVPMDLDVEAQVEVGVEPPSGEVTPGEEAELPVLGEGEQVLIKTTTTTVEFELEIAEELLEGESSPVEGETPTEKEAVVTSKSASLVGYGSSPPPTDVVDQRDSPASAELASVSAPASDNTQTADIPASDVLSANGTPVAAPAAVGLPMTPPLSHTASPARPLGVPITPALQIPFGAPSTPAVQGPPAIPPSPAPMHVVGLSLAARALPSVDPSPMPQRVVNMAGTAPLVTEEIEDEGIPKTPAQEQGLRSAPPTPAPVHVADFEMAVGF